MLRFVVLVGLLAAVHGQTTQVSQCISNAGELPINTYIEGCIEPPCLLPQMQDAVVNIIFRAPRVMREMRTVAWAYIMNQEINYGLGSNAVTCNFLTNSYCPVIQNEVLAYTLRMPISILFPVNAQPTIEFQIVDEHGEAVACLRVVVRIVRRT